MPNRLSDFKKALAFGGARPNLFEVTISAGTLPDGVTPFDDEDFTMLCKAAQLPASNVASIDVPFRGRTFKVAGDRTFDTWTITVINDNDFKIRKSMEEWMQYVAQYEDGSGATTPQTYMRDALVHQLGRQKSNVGSGTANASGEGLEKVKTYVFKDIFPTNVSAIDLSFDSSDTIEEFTVEFQVQYWYPGAENAPAG